MAQIDSQLRYRDLLRKLVMLSIPTMVEEILSTLLQYVDTAMVGRLGEQATASVSVTTTIGWLVGSTAYAVGAAVLALISRAYGARDSEKGRKLAQQALLLTIVIGAVLGGVSILLSPYIPVWMGAEESIRSQASLYFTIISLPMVFRAGTAILGSSVRATQNTKTPMIITLSSNLLNIILNYLLIYTAGLGVTGAAFATAISFTVGGVMMLVLFLRTPFFGLCVSSSAEDTELSGGTQPESILTGNSSAGMVRSGRRISLRPDPAILREIGIIGIPIMGTSVVSCMGYVVFAGLVSGMGTTIFAAHSIAVTAETIFYVPGYGLRTATSALVGAALGERNTRKLQVYCRISVALTVGMMFLSGLVLFFVAEPLMSVFSPSRAVVELGAQMLKLVAFSEPFLRLMVVMQGIMYGMGKTRYPFLVEAFSMWGVRILFTFLTVHMWGGTLREVWYCMIADNVCKAVLLSVIFVFGKLYRTQLPDAHASGNVKLPDAADSVKNRKK